MALLATRTAVAISVQSVPGTYVAPTTADLLPVANCSLDIAGVTISNPEYTGSVQRQGDAVAGKTVSLRFTVMLRPPGGASPPAAGTFIHGRLLRAAKFTESIIATAVPAAPEAIGAAPTTTQVTLGATAVGTLDLYKGLSLLLTDNAGGARPKALTAIRSYSAGKVAVFPETLASAPAALYQIPRQIAYLRDITAADPASLSMKVWIDGHRYDLVDMSVSAMKITAPVSTREGANFPVIEYTLNGDIFADADEATPTVPSLGPIPVFKDGDMWVANKALGGSELSIDMGLKSAYPPNPNRTSGNDPAQLIEARPSVSLTLNHNLKATLDALALADAQAYHPVWAQWGYTAGNIVSVLVTDARFNYRSPNIGSDVVTDQGDMFIDVASANISIAFPY
jgi:hypothetical protein